MPGHDSVSDLLGMSEEQLKALIAKVQTDKSLQKLKPAANADADIAIRIAKEAGFKINLEEIYITLSY
ncbi:MAG: Nif11-like leader peptide family RiPP precursor [Prochlorococcus sp.]